MRPEGAACRWHAFSADRSGAETEHQIFFKITSVASIIQSFSRPSIPDEQKSEKKWNYRLLLVTDWEQLPILKQSHKHSIPVCFYYTDSGKALHSQSTVYAFVYLCYNKNKRGRIIFSVEFLSCLFFISIRRPIPRKISAWSKDRNSKVSRGAARPLAGRIQRNRRFRGTRLSRKV